MTECPHYQTVRTVPYAARSFLDSLGYCTVHVSSSLFPIDVIAWRGREELLFVTLISSRDRKNQEKFRKRICELTSLVRTIPFHGEVQLWTHTPGCWDRYRVMPGGIYSLSGGSA